MRKKFSIDFSAPSRLVMSHKVVTAAWRDFERGYKFYIDKFLLYPLKTFAKF